MKAFHFSLQQLLDIKEALERAAEVRVGDAQRKLIQGEQRLVLLHSEMRAQHVSQVATLNDENVNRHDVTVRLLFVSRMEKHVEKQEEHVGKCRLKVEEARGLLLAAMRDRKSLENMMEKEKQQWVAEGRRADRRDMDEMAIARFVRQERLA